MRKTFLYLIGLAVAAVICSCGTPSATVKADKVIASQRQSFLSAKKTASIDSLIRLLPQGSEVGISVYNLTRNKTVFTYRDQKLSRPASTMKLLTTITTLSYPEGREAFATNVYYTGNIVRDTLQGNLYIRGCMDPEFDDRAMDSLVAQIRQMPFKVLKGQIIGDVSMKDSLYWGAGWMWDDAPYDYQPQLSPLMFHKGTIKVTARADSTNQKVILSAEPVSSYYTLVNETQCRTPDAGKFNVIRDYLKQSNRIIVTGNVDSLKSATITLSNVPDYFLQTFTERLKSKGGKSICGSYGYSYTPATDYEKAQKVASWSTPCEDVVRQILKVSDNLNAEAMFYRLSNINGFHPATAEGGVQAIQKLIANIGLDASHYNLADGSGLSNYDCISPQLEVSFLKYAYQHPDVYNILYPRLPIAGIDGSLKRRLTDSYTKGNVHAKTGSYTAINALAGYLTDSTGDLMAFSIMNQNIFSPKTATAFQDNICRILCK